MENIQKEHKYQKLRNTWNRFYWNIRFGHRVREHTNTGEVTRAREDAGSMDYCLPYYCELKQNGLETDLI